MAGGGGKGGGSSTPQEEKDLLSQLALQGQQSMQHGEQLFGQAAPFFGPALQQMMSNAGWVQTSAGTPGTPGTTPTSVAGWNGQGSTTESQRASYVENHPDLKAQWGQAGNKEAIEASMRRDLGTSAGGPPGQSAQGYFAPIQNQDWYRNAMEQAGKGFNAGANQLKYQANQMGTGSSPAMTAALANLARGQQQDIGNFTRIQAPEIQNQRIQQAMGLAAPGLGNVLGFGSNATGAAGAGVQGWNGAVQNQMQGQQNQNALITGSMSGLGQFLPYIFVLVFSLLM